MPLLLLLLTACSGNKKKEIIRLDIAPADSLTDIRNAWTEIRGDFPAEKEAIFAEAVNCQLPPLDSVEAVLAQSGIADSITLVGVINPFISPIVSNGKYIFIGLNHYLGADSEAYNGFPQYLRRLKTIQRLPIDVISEYVFKQSNLAEPENPTVLTMLLFTGSVFNTTLKMLPKGTSEALVLGMTDEEYDWCRQNEQRIWQKIIEDGLLYSSDLNIIRKLFSPSPSATLINAHAPGNTMQYIGLKIAQAYEKNTGRDASPSNEYILDNQSLVNSKYSPQNVSR